MREKHSNNIKKEEEENVLRNEYLKEGRKREKRSKSPVCLFEKEKKKESTRE